MPAILIGGGGEGKEDICQEGTRPSRSLQSASYLFSVVGTSRCDVRAACSGATPSIASVAPIFVPPATTRAGTAQRAIPTIALNTYSASRRLVPDAWKTALHCAFVRRASVFGETP